MCALASCLSQRSSCQLGTWSFCLCTAGVRWICFSCYRSPSQSRDIAIGSHSCLSLAAPRSSWYSLGNTQHSLHSAGEQTLGGHNPLEGQDAAGNHGRSSLWSDQSRQQADWPLLWPVPLQLTGDWCGKGQFIGARLQAKSHHCDLVRHKSLVVQHC